ncbi:MAG TPA: methyltransferase domain-containing protein [Gaiellaceae bacterium]|nr:methyltransferase domain-containing protein [Gaiellaceae bacterium]
MGAPAELDRAGAYDAWYDTPLGAAAHRIELRLIAELAAPKRGERALDVGCGTGINTVWLAELECEVTGVDRDPAMLPAARAKAPGARFVEGDATALPFAEDEFDLAFAITLFCFLSAAQRAAAAGELVRVVRPGGRIVVGELARHSLWAAERRIKGWRGSPTWRSVHFTTADELRRLLRDAGATAVRSRYGMYLPPWGVPALVCRAEAIERLGRPLGPLGAAFVVVRADVA